MRSSSQAVEARLEDRILVVTLDAPGEVNVLSRPIAKQLTSILHEVDPNAVDALVLQSGKPRSFLNGVGLMLAGAVQTPEDVTRLSAEVRTCYRMLAELPVPTIAAVRGNCYGCGVELVLRCDHRIAADDFATHFYMSEVADYLFVPCFGGTWELPRLVGLPRATDLVLWGRRWSAQEAARARLVDACFPVESFESDALAYARDIIADRRPPATAAGPALLDPDWVDDTLRRIYALPAPYHDVCRDTFELMHRAASGMGDASSALGRELLAAGRTIVTSSSKAAQGFFFVRQTATLTSIGERRPETRFRLVPAARSDLLAEIAARHVVDVAVGAPDPTAHGAEVVISVGSMDHPASVAVCVDASGDDVSWPTDVLAYAPGLRAGGELVEVACQPHSFPLAQAVCDALDRAGMRAVLTSPSRRFVTDDLVEAFFAPLVAWLDEDGSIEDILATLHANGWLRPLSGMLPLLPERHPGRVIARSLSDFAAGDAAPELMDAIEVSLAAAAKRALEGGAARHPAIVDLIAREAIDWPLARGSLCRTLDADHMEQVLERAAGFERLVRPSDRERVRQYATEGRSFYR